MPYKTREKHHNTKYPDSLVKLIRKEHFAYIKGKGYLSLARKYGLSYSTVKDWCQYRTRISAR